MDIINVPQSELKQRMSRFISEMDKAHEAWELCAITGAASMFYLTGTICDGLLLIPRNGEGTLWVRRSYERAILESEFADIRQMSSFRTVAETLDSKLPYTLYLDTAHATLEWYSMLTKHLPFKEVLSNDAAIMNARSIKSEYELMRMRRAGSESDSLLTAGLMELVEDGISEAVLGAKLLTQFIKKGHHGISRFNMRNAADLLGHIAFGAGSLFPSVFNGASGTAGFYPAAPAMGRHTRHLSPGDLIYIDVCFGFDGYHVDKTQIYSYKAPPPDNVLAAHRHCLELERQAAKLLRPGAKPSDIYEEILALVRQEHSDSFMGAPGRTVPFIGHSVGLSVDETPVIARGFDSPLEENMTIAIEPKIGFEGIGLVGSENTYLVTDSGGVSLTGVPLDIIRIG